MRKYKKLLLIAALLTLAGAAYGWHLYNKKPADVRKQKAELSINSMEIVKQFRENEEAAAAKFVDGIIVVSGMISSVNLEAGGKATVILESGDPLSGVICSFYPDEAAAVSRLTPGSKAEIKGLCTGMLSDVVLIKCSIVTTTN